MINGGGTGHGTLTVSVLRTVDHPEDARGWTPAVDHERRGEVSGEAPALA